MLVLSILVINFGIQTQKSMIKSQDEKIKQVGLLDFKVGYKDADCFIEGEYCYRLIIQNNEEFQLNFIITTITSLGSEISGLEEYYAEPYGQKVFVVSYSKDLGKENIRAEVRGIKIQ